MAGKEAFFGRGIGWGGWLLGIWLLVAAGCYSSKGGPGGNATDGSVDGASFLDGGVESGAGEQDAGPPLNACSAGEPGCTCEWSPAFRLGSVSYAGFTGGMYLLSDLAHDASGAAVVGWGGFFQTTDGTWSEPFRMHVLDPSTERWAEETPALPNGIGIASLARDDQGSLLVFAKGTDQADWTWSRLDAVTHRWSEPALLGLQYIDGQIITSPGYTYWVDYPVVSRFTGERFEPSRETEPESHYEGTSIAIDHNGNLLAAWDDVHMEQAFAPSFGTHSFPVYDSVSVDFYQGSSGEWSTPVKLVSDGRLSDIAFASDGDAYALLDIGEEQQLQKRDAVGGQWTEVEVLSGDYSFYNNGAGELYRVRACSDAECVFASDMLDPENETWPETTVDSSGSVEAGSIQLAFAGGHGVAQWFEDCDSDDICSASASISVGANDWSPLTTIAPSIQRDMYGNPPPLAIGEDGTAALAWIQPRSWPHDEPEKLFVVRYDPSAASWSDPVQLDAVEGMGSLRITVDFWGYVTALWIVAADPALPERSGFFDEIWTSRYACRLQTPEGTPREEEPEEPSSLPAPGCLDPSDSGCGPCGWRSVQRIATEVVFRGDTNVVPMVGVNDFGRAVVAWVETRGIYAASRSPAGTWGPATVIEAFDEGSSERELRRVIVDESGAALLLWETNGWRADGSRETEGLFWSHAPSGSTGELSWSAPAHQAESEERILGGFDTLTVRGSALVTWGDGSYVARLIARFDFESGTWSLSPDLGTPDCTRAFSAGLEPAGNAVAYWIEQERSADDTSCIGPWTLRVNRMGADGSWGAPQSLAEMPESGHSLQLAPDDGGNVGLVWLQKEPFGLSGDTVWAAYYDAASSTISEPQHVGLMVPCSPVPQVVRTPDGVTAVWSNSWAVDACNPGDTAGTWSSELDPGTGQWSTARSVRVAPASTPNRDLTALPLGNGVLAYWTDEPDFAYAQGEQVLAAWLPSSSSGWDPAQVLDGPIARGPRIAADDNGNALAVWDRVTGGADGSWVIHGNRFAAAAGSWVEQPVAISQDRGFAGRGAYDLGASPAGTGILSWSTERSIWAAFFTCDAP